MEVFRFLNPNAPTRMESGDMINGLTSKTWVERYTEAGECKFVAPARTLIREKLPIGAFVSHVNTKEIMMIENHEITGNQGEEIQVAATGHSFETIFDERIVGSNRPVGPVGPYMDYVIEKGLPWHQLVNLIRRHINAEFLFDDNDEIPYVDISQVVDQLGLTAEIIPRTLERGSLYEHILAMLKKYNLGIKTIRPPGKDGSPNTTVTIHKGVDRSHEMVFSYETGEITNIDYLFSRKPLKNAALVSSKWCELMVYSDASAKINRRVMHVSATDIDQDHEAMPVATELELIGVAMWYRGMQALAAQNEVALKKAEITSDSVRYKYREDYDLGDLVGIGGGYLTSGDEATAMRITEYVETEDENGSSSYPTLVIDPPTTA